MDLTSHAIIYRDMKLSNTNSRIILWIFHKFLLESDNKIKTLSKEKCHCLFKMAFVYLAILIEKYEQISS